MPHSAKVLIVQGFRGVPRWGMNDSQFYVLVAVPLVGILLNGGLFMYIGGRVDDLTKTVSELSSRVAVLEDRRGRA